MTTFYNNNELTQPNTDPVKWEFASMETKGIYKDWEEMPEDLYQLPDEEYERLTSAIGMQVTGLTFKSLDPNSEYYGRSIRLDGGSTSVDRKKPPSKPHLSDEWGQALLQA